MLDTVFSTDDLPPADRFECWYELTRGPHIPVISHTDHVSGFHAGARRLDLDAVRVYSMTGSTVRATRPARLVRRYDPEHCSLYCVVRGEYRLAQADQVTVLGAGDLVFADSSQPYDGWLIQTRADPAGWQHVHVQFPRALLPRPDLVARLVGRRLSSQDGLRNLVAHYLQELVKPTAEYRAGDATGLATTTVDLVATLLAHELDKANSLPPETQEHVLLLRILEFMRRHLGDPGLSPDTIAAAHYISTRYLHKLFQTQDLTVAAWIRHHRLVRCHDDLADPRHSSHPIHVIAARWGFTDKAHFSRIFRATYGISPSDYRRLPAPEVWLSPG